MYMTITQTRCTMALFLVVISEERRHRRRLSPSGLRSRGKSCACAEHKIRSDPLERIHAGVMQLSIE